MNLAQDALTIAKRLVKPFTSVGVFVNFCLNVAEVVRWICGDDEHVAAARARLRDGRREG